MSLADLIAQGSVLHALNVNSKKQVLQILSEAAALETGLPDREIFDVILQRERLGSTGVGNGIAIPHGKLPKLDRIVGFVAKLQEPIDFEALDDQPVDMVFMLLAPEDAGADHLKALSKIARVLRDKNLVEKLRGAQSEAAIYALLTQGAASNAA